MTDFGIEILARAESLESDVVANYVSHLDDGRVLKCTTVIVRDQHGKPIGIVCINLDLCAPLWSFAKHFVLPETDALPSGHEEHFPVSVQGLVASAVQRVKETQEMDEIVPARKKRRRIVAELYGRGIFDVGGAVDLVAREMGVSRFTIYNDIREAKPRPQEVSQFGRPGTKTNRPSLG